MAFARCTRLVLGSLLVLLTGTVHGEDAKPPRTDLCGDPLPPGAMARLGTIRLRHARADVVFSKDGKQLITCDGNGEIRIWDAATGKLVQRKQLNGTPQKDEFLQKAIFSSDSTLAAIRNGWTVRCYDARTGRERGCVRAEGLSELLTFSANEKVLALTTDAKNVFLRTTHTRGGYDLQLWNTDDCKLKRTLGSIEKFPIALTADGNRLAAIGSDQKLHLWDTASGAEISKSKEREAEATSLAFSPDGKLLAVASAITPTAGGKVELRDGATLKTIGELRIAAGLKADFFGALTFSPDGRLLVGSYYVYVDERTGEAGVVLWDIKEEKRARKLRQGGWMERFVFSGDCRTLAGYTGVDSEIRLWEMPSGRPLLRRPVPNSPVRALVASPDGKMIGSVDGEPMPQDVSGATVRITAYNDPRPVLRLWDAATGKLLRVLKGDPAIHSCFFSPDVKQVISVGMFGTVEVWDVETGKKRLTFEVNAPDGKGIFLSAAGISTDGKRLVAAGASGWESGSRYLFVCDLATGRQRERRPYAMQLEDRFRFKAHCYRVIEKHFHAAFAPDGDSVSVLQGDRLGIEELATRCLLAMLPKDVGVPLFFSPDGRLVAAVVKEENDPDENRRLSILETASGAEVVRLAAQAFDHIAFTPDSRSLVMVGEKNLRVWDTDTGECLHEMAWPESIRDPHGRVEISSLAVLPGGRAATAMPDGDTLIWDLRPSTWPARNARRDLDPREHEALWSDLAGEAHKARCAISRLDATPEQTVPLLSKHLQPADARSIVKLLADLDAELYETREAASRKLARMHYRAEPMLRQALKDKPSLEMRLRIKAILAEPRLPSAEDLRMLRAIDVLERIATPEARRVLEKLADGAAAPKTREAQAALQRLNYRDARARGRSTNGSVP